MGFLGVILILRPTEELFNVASFVGLGAGLFGAIAFTAIRRLTKTEPPERITFYYMLSQYHLLHFLLLMDGKPLTFLSGVF